MPFGEFHPNGGPTWASSVRMSGVSSTFWLTTHYDCWHCALHSLRSLKHLESKPVIRKTDDGWQVRYQPKMVLLNGVA